MEQSRILIIYPRNCITSVGTPKYPVSYKTFPVLSRFLTFGGSMFWNKKSLSVCMSSTEGSLMIPLSSIPRKKLPPVSTHLSWLSVPCLNLQKKVNLFQATFYYTCNNKIIWQLWQLQWMLLSCLTSYAQEYFVCQDLSASYKMWSNWYHNFGV